MSLTARDVAEITRLLDESSFTELTLEMEGLKLTLRRGAAAGTPAAQVLPTGTSDPAPVPASTAAMATATPAATAATAIEPGTESVRAPLLGTFYRAPKPGAPPFVEVGSAVEPDTIVGIIEVMKLMNTVRAGRRGTVAQILARDGALVEYDEPLMQLRP